jgi:hypothetical protein
MGWQAKLNISVPYILIMVVVCVAYGPTLENDFALDDEVVRNGDYPATLAEIPYLWFEAVPQGSTLVYRPFTFASFACDRVLWGTSPTGYHLSNMLLATVAAWLIFALGRQLLPLPYALCAALCFAVLPGQCEAVVAVSNRSQLLGAVAMIAVLLFLPRTLRQDSSPRWLGLSGVVTLLGCYAKETAFVIPLLTLLWVQGTQLAADRNKLRRILTWQVVACLLYVVSRLMVISTLAAPGLPGSHFAETESATTRYFTAAFCFTTYVRLVVWPFPLSCDYPLSPVSFHFMGLLYPVLVAFLVYWLWRGKPLLRQCSMAILWFLVCLLPALHIVPLVMPIAERLLYPAAWGIPLCFAILLARLPAKRFLHYTLWILASTVIAAASVVTMHRAIEWHDNYSLWHSAEEVFPQSYRAAIFRGSEYAREGHAMIVHGRKEEAAKCFAKAILYYEKALAAKANTANRLLVYYNLALVWHLLDERRKAEQSLYELFTLQADYAPAWMFLGDVAARAGDWERALLCYRKVTGPRNRWDRQYAEVKNRIAKAEKTKPGK